MEVEDSLMRAGVFIAYSATPVVAAVLAHRLARSRSLVIRVASGLGVAACMWCGYVLATHLP